MSQSLIKPTGWASELNYASGPNAGQPTKVRPSTTTQQYGIHAQRRPSATELNYVLNSADALLAAFELHGVTNFLPPFAIEDATFIYAIHRPPLGGTLLLTSGGILWYTSGADGATALDSEAAVRAGVTLTNAVYGSDTLTLCAYVDDDYLYVLGLDKVWPHAADGFGDYAGIINQGLDYAGSGGSLSMSWDETHQLVHLFSQDGLASVNINNFTGGMLEFRPDPTGNNTGKKVAVTAPHGTTVAFALWESFRSEDGANWELGPEILVDIVSPAGTGTLNASTHSLHWWSTLRDRWYLITQSSWTTAVLDLWESLDDGVTWNHICDLSAKMGGYNAIDTRQAPPAVRQFRAFGVRRNGTSTTALAILDETDFTLRVQALAGGSSSGYFLGADSGSLFWQIGDQVYRSSGAIIPPSLERL